MAVYTLSGAIVGQGVMCLMALVLNHIVLLVHIVLSNLSGETCYTSAAFHRLRDVCAQILDSVRVHELPSAAGLILKLASQSSGPARLAAVKAVRQKLRLTPQAMTPGVLDAFRLVVMQHADVALEIVEGVDRQCGSLAATGSPSQVTASMLFLTRRAYKADAKARCRPHLKSAAPAVVTLCWQLCNLSRFV